MNKINQPYKKILLILSHNNFSDTEYYKSKAVFESYGFKCIVASSKLNPSVGMEGSLVRPDLHISNINVTDYTAICLIGGVGCIEFWHNKTIHELIIEANKKRLLLGAICLAPIILTNAGLLKGKRATAYPSAESFMKKHGVQYSPKAIEIEENIITAKGPEVAGAFASEISGLLDSEVNFYPTVDI